MSAEWRMLRAFLPVQCKHIVSFNRDGYLLHLGSNNSDLVSSSIRLRSIVHWLHSKSTHECLVSDGRVREHLGTGFPTSPRVGS